MAQIKKRTALNIKEIQDRKKLLFCKPALVDTYEIKLHEQMEKLKGQHRLMKYLQLDSRYNSGKYDKVDFSRDQLEQNIKPKPGVKFST